MRHGNAGERTVAHTWREGDRREVLDTFVPSIMMAHLAHFCQCFPPRLVDGRAHAWISAIPDLRLCRFDHLYVHLHSV